jgi:hypothetical protein
MPTVKRPPGRKRGEVTADDVVAAAIDIVDREGVDALTIWRGAEACGLSPTAAALRPTGSRKSDELDRPGRRDGQLFKISDPNNIHA